jgi:thioredoxin 1
MQTISLTGRSWRPWLGQVMLAGSRRARLGDMEDLNDSTFEDFLSAPALVVDFWSPSCLPCLRYKPIFMDVASLVQNVTFATVNADESPNTMAKYNIESIPATLFFVNGQLVKQTSGPMTNSDLTAAIQSVMPAAPPPTTTPTPPDQVMPQTQGPIVPPNQTAPTPPSPKAAPQPKPATQAPAAASTPAKAAPAPAAGAAPAQDSGTLKTVLIIGGVGVLAVGTIALLAGGK